jgi:cytochrome c-type biogenesis protein
MNVDYLTAFGAGALSFLSPCVLPLVPAYLCYMAGVTVDDFRLDIAGSASRTKLLKASLLFVLGFGTVFVALGAGASSVGQLAK